MGNRIKGKAALVTGAGSIGPGIGNGRATSILFAREGAQVMLIDLNLKAVKKTQNMIEKEGGECHILQADVSRPNECKDCIEECIKTYGRIDILHNNVGIAIPGGIDTLSEEDWDKTMNTNLKSVFFMCKYAIPYMQKQKCGSIINISSIHAIRSLPALNAAYAVSKAGLGALTRDIAIQYAAKGIRANIIMLGYMSTPLIWSGLDKLDIHSIDAKKEALKQRDAMCPTGKQGDAWDGAYLALFLASDEAKYITGTTMVVDGGVTCVVRAS